MPSICLLCPYSGLLQVGPGQQNRFSLLASRGGAVQGAPLAPSPKAAKGSSDIADRMDTDGDEEGVFTGNKGAANGKGTVNGTAESGSTHRNGKGAGTGEIEEEEDAMDEGEGEVGEAGAEAQSALDEEAEEAGWELKARLKSALKEKADAFSGGKEPEDDIRLGEEGWKRRYYEQKFGVRTDEECERVVADVVSIAQYSTAQCCRAQHSTVKHNPYHTAKNPSVHFCQ